MLRLLVISAFMIALLGSCGILPGKDKNRKDAIARVYDKYLYAEDLESVIPSGTSATDSLEITTAYINNWVRQELLLKQAEDNLDETHREFSKQIEL